MKTPVIAIEATIYGVDGEPIASCRNAELAAYVAERINGYAGQYAQGHADATNEVNARRDRETREIRRQAEERGYNRAVEEEIRWTIDPSHALAA